METYCTREEWINGNNAALNWYRETYPFLTNVGFPVSTEILKKFYIEDSDNRNITPNPQILDCYEFLLSYFLDNYPNVDNPDRFVARNWFQLLIDSFPAGVSKTFTDIGNVGSGFLNSTKYIFFIILIVAIIYFWNQIK